MKTISHSLTLLVAHLSFGSALFLVLFWGSSALPALSSSVTPTRPTRRHITSSSSMTTNRNARRLDLPRSKARSMRPRLETLSKFVLAPITSRWRSPNG